MALKVGKHTTLTGTLAQGAISATLSSAAFDNGTAVPLVLEYDSDSNVEAITADISGTALTNIVRAKDGTADIAHTGTPKIGQTSHPSAWQYFLNNDTATGTSSVGIPAAAMRQEAWTDWTPDTRKSDGTTALASTNNGSSYIIFGKTFIANIYLSSVGDPADASFIIKAPTGITFKQIDHVNQLVGACTFQGTGGTTAEYHMGFIAVRDPLGVANALWVVSADWVVLPTSGDLNIAATIVAKLA